MSLQEVFQEVSHKYAAAKQEAFSGHPLASFIRDTGSEILRDVISRPSLLVEGSPGQGNWADVPWFGIFNPEITTTATKGFYVVYLFKTDMSELSLCMGQGVTALKEEFKKDAISEMRRRADLICSRVPEFKNHFQAGTISLGGTTQLAKSYDSGVAFQHTYKTSSLPSEETLQLHLKEMLKLYDYLISRGGVDNIETAISLLDEGEADTLSSIEEQKKYVRHSRIERNSKAAKLAKKVHGYVCQVCDFDFEKAYGVLGKEFIEAHHLMPLSTLPEGQTVSMDSRKDFAVLCSNCHRMIHRGRPWLTLEELRKILKRV